MLNFIGISNESGYNQASIFLIIELSLSTSTFLMKKQINNYLIMLVYCATRV